MPAFFLPDERGLRRLAGLARKAGGPLLAGIHPRLMGCESMAATPDPDDWKQPLDEVCRHAWRQLRAHPDACWIGLAMPRILLRLPYGGDPSGTESFDFQEMPQPPLHEAYLWGSPAIALVCLLGQGFTANGWQLHPGQRNRLDGLPAHNYHAGGESLIMPPSETWLTDRVAAQILDQGVMPLASSRSSNSILLVKSQSIADPPRPLAGGWEV
jgi:type VI secretion system protein ImpC